MVKKFTFLLLAACLVNTAQPINKKLVAHYWQVSQSAVKKAVYSPKTWAIGFGLLAAQQTYVHSQATSWYNPVYEFSWSWNPFNWGVVQHWASGIWALFKGNEVKPNSEIQQLLNLYFDELEEDYVKLLDALQVMLNETPKEEKREDSVSSDVEGTEVIVIDDNKKDVKSTSPELLTKKDLEKKIEEQKKKLEQRKKELFNFGKNSKVDTTGSIESILKRKQELEDEVKLLKTRILSYESNNK